MITTIFLLSMALIGCEKGAYKKAPTITSESSNLGADAVGWNGLGFGAYRPEGFLGPQEPKVLSSIPQVFSVESTNDFILKARTFAPDSFVIVSDPSAPKDIKWRAIRRK
jgi:hypothetical protein